MSRAPGRLALLGASLGHSLSPRMQNAALREAGIALAYEALEVSAVGLRDVLAGLIAESGAGNVTIPHKAAVADACARRTDVAERTGAVNTFWTDGGHLIGDNTDVAGFKALASRVVGTIPRGASVALIGAGGGAAAVCAAVDEWEGRTTIYNRDAERARRLASRFASALATIDSAQAVREADIVVNATPIGLGDDEMPVDPAMLARDAVVIDLAYRPGETHWVRRARELGHRAGDGLEMLIEQGACAFERWFGFRPNVEVMRAAITA